MAKKDFLCIMPDIAGAQEKRLAVREQHLDNARAHNRAGSFAWGGAMVEQHPAQGTVPTFKGSVLLMQCETADEAWEQIRKDIYATTGVWDLEKTTVTPMLTAFWPAASSS